MLCHIFIAVNPDKRINSRHHQMPEYILMIKPTIYKYDTCKKFAEEFHIEKGDLVITNEYIYEPFFGKLNQECDVIYQEK